jgi:hypothetical protein
MNCNLSSKNESFCGLVIQKKMAAGADISQICVKIVYRFRLELFGSVAVW